MPKPKKNLPVIACMAAITLLAAALVEQIYPGSFFIATTVFLSAGIAFSILRRNFSKLDLTSEKHAHSQKMQSLGQFSSAIAHDFNNLLTIIIGNSDLILNRYQQDHDSFKDAYQIKASALRGAKLVRQLLSFARKSSLEPVNINIAELFNELNPLFSKLLSEKYNILLENIEEKAIIYADPIQVEQIIINLVTNARDAMPEGGDITISSSFAYVEGRDSLSGYYKADVSKIIEPGQYVRVEVADSGSGISSEILPKIFDPFFSTKNSEGTGLGLTTVFQIIEKIGGHLFVKSEKDIGTSFIIYIKQVQNNDESVLTQPLSDKTIIANRSSYNILFVEDEDPVRMFGAHALKEFGFNIYDVKTAEEALEVIKQSDKKIDLLITDITLDSMDGISLAKLIKEQIPNLKIVVTSGHDEKSISGSKLGYLFLSKPYTLKELINTANKALAD